MSVFECDRIALIGFLAGLFAAGAVALIITTGNLASLSILLANIPLAVFYITRRKDWLRKQEELGASALELRTIKEKIDKICEEYE